MKDAMDPALQVIRFIAAAVFILFFLAPGCSDNAPQSNKLKDKSADLEEKEEESVVKIMTYEKKINDIKKKFSVINENVDNYTIRSKESGSEDFAARLFIYLEGSNIRKLAFKVGRANNTGETEEYYYWNGELFFVFEKRYYPDFAKMEEDGDILEPPTINEENRYYFSDGKMIRVLDTNKKEISPQSDHFLEMEKTILEKENNLFRIAQSPGDSM